MLKLITQKFPKTSAFIFNLRFPQLLYHAGLVLVGFGLSFEYANPSWTINLLDLIKLLFVILGAWSAWIASVIVNDVVDLKIDQVSNSQRPLPQKIFSVEEYLGLGLIFFLGSIVFSGLADWRIIFFILLYQLLAFLYSAWPIRLKRFPIVATFTSALASVLIAFSGFIIASPSHSLASFPLSIAMLLIVGYTLALPIKDFKDFAGDKADRVFTLPVIFGIPWAKVIVGGGLFFSFMLSVIILQDFHLFWWAFFCGTASFTLVMKMQKPVNGRWLTYRNIFWWMIATITLYLSAIVFSFLE